MESTPPAPITTPQDLVLRQLQANVIRYDSLRGIVMQHEAMIETLKGLKLHGMAHAIDELAKQGSPAYKGAESILDSLLKAEVAEREVRSVNYQVKVARFPAYRDLSGFDFSQSVVNEAFHSKPASRRLFMDNAENVVLIGGPGTGKTHLATALAVQAIMHLHRRVRFFDGRVGQCVGTGEASRQNRGYRQPSHPYGPSDSL